MDDDDIECYSPPPPMKPLTRTPLIPRRFPYPEEYSVLGDDDESTDSSKSLLRSSNQREYLRQSIYDPLPHSVQHNHHHDSGMSTSLLHSLNRPGNKLTSSGLYSSSIKTNNNHPPRHSPSPPPPRPQHFQSGHYFAPPLNGEHQKVCKILEESAKSKGFLIKFLFGVVFILILIITAIIMGGIGLVINGNHRCSSEDEGNVQAIEGPSKKVSPYDEPIWQQVEQVGQF